MARQFDQEPSVGANLLTEFACDVATRAVFFASIFVVFSFISFLLVSTGNDRARDKLQIKCACSGAREKTLAGKKQESVWGVEGKEEKKEEEEASANSKQDKLLMFIRFFLFLLIASRAFILDISKRNLIFHFWFDRSF